MSESTRAIRKELNNEIKLLEERYGTIWGYLRGTDFDYLIILESLQAFSEGLKRISTHIMALYQLEGQKTKITWDPLLNNIDEFVRMNQNKPNKDLRGTLQLTLKMSDPKIEEVMTYLTTLKNKL